jgi:DNA-binding transcriptional ArsR family regulator
MKKPDIQHEPRIARVAAMLADPARSRMLAYLLSGEYASAGELAGVASVTPATASGHLGKLLDGRLIVCEARGRHRYYRLADADVAHALEALSLVAERGAHDKAWAHPHRQQLKDARCCYGHLAGKLGVRLFDTLHAGGALRSAPDGYELTSAAHACLAGIGLEVPKPSGQRRFAYACLDWSERRDHLAGQLADELYRHFVDQAWLKRGDGRAVTLTPLGIERLSPWLCSGS